MELRIIFVLYSDEQVWHLVFYVFWLVSPYLVLVALLIVFVHFICAFDHENLPSKMHFQNEPSKASMPSSLLVFWH